MKFPKLTVVEWLIVVCIIILAASILKPIIFRQRDLLTPSQACYLNLNSLGKAILVYHNEFDKYPTPSKWCDLLFKHADVPEKTFYCFKNKRDRCSYTINPNCEPNSPNDIVLLFESKGGWNQYGGPELLNFENHEGYGCNILFNDKSVEFVRKEEVAELNWEDQKDNDSALLEGFENILLEFISKNKHKPSLQMFDVNEKSVEGPKSKEKDDLWFVGEWSVRKFDSYDDILGTPGKKVFESYDTCFLAVLMPYLNQIRVYIGKNKDNNRLVFVVWEVLMI